MAGMGFALVLLIALALLGLWYLHRRRLRKRAKKVKMLTYDPTKWHHNDCEKVQTMKVCNCSNTEPTKTAATVHHGARMCTCGTAGGSCRGLLQKIVRFKTYLCLL